MNKWSKAEEDKFKENYCNRDKKDIDSYKYKE